jgi:hypothetical protein
MQNVSACKGTLLQSLSDRISAHQQCVEFRCLRLAACVVAAGDAEAWRSAGGESYCENQEFTNLLAARWMEVLSRPGAEGFRE